MVAFLDIAPHEGGLVNGAAIPVEQGELPDLDRRERNYRRVEVTDHLDTRLPGGGTVWAYVGLRASRERAVRGRREGRLVVSRGYYERVRDGFAAIGERRRSRGSPGRSWPRSPTSCSSATRRSPSRARPARRRERPRSAYGTM